LKGERRRPQQQHSSPFMNAIWAYNSMEKRIKVQISWKSSLRHLRCCFTSKGESSK